ALVDHAAGDAPAAVLLGRVDVGDRAGVLDPGAFALDLHDRHLGAPHRLVALAAHGQLPLLLATALEAGEVLALRRRQRGADRLVVAGADRLGPALGQAIDQFVV